MYVQNDCKSIQIAYNSILHQYFCLVQTMELPHCTIQKRRPKLGLIMVKSCWYKYCKFYQAGYFVAFIIDPQLVIQYLYRCPTSCNIAGWVFSYRRKHFFQQFTKIFSCKNLSKSAPNTDTLLQPVRFSTGYGHAKLLIECWFHVRTKARCPLSGSSSVFSGTWQCI